MSKTKKSEGREGIRGEGEDDVNAHLHYSHYGEYDDDY